MIIVEQVSKRFELNAGHGQNLSAQLASGLGRALRGRKRDRTYLQALDQVSFTVERGEILGIFGRNGAGKSTLLNLLSGVLRPDGGQITLEGRVASILDIGTGFHPDLSGRRNVFLNGRLRGMADAEIEARMEEIHAFSGIGNFLDEPIKRYSNGMYLRLAFSIFAHMDTDIFLLDEVISVGDAEFRKKSRDKIKELARAGATMVVVSHDLGELMQLCTDFMYLEKGRVVERSRDLSVLRKYAETAILPNATEGKSGEGERPRRVWKNMAEAPGTPQMRLLQVEVRAKGEEGVKLYVDQALEVVLEFQREEGPEAIDLLFSISDVFGNIVMSCSPHRNQQFFQRKDAGRYRLVCTIPANLMNVGTYTMNVSALKGQREIIFMAQDILPFRLENRLEFGNIPKAFIENAPGALCPAFEWELTYSGT